MPDTLPACSFTLSWTLPPKVLNPAIAMSAITPTRMMYSTRLAPLVSPVRALRCFFMISPGNVSRESGERRREHVAGPFVRVHERRAGRDDGEHHGEPHGPHQDDVLGLHGSALVAGQLLEDRSQVVHVGLGGHVKQSRGL